MNIETKKLFKIVNGVRGYMFLNESLTYGSSGIEDLKKDIDQLHIENQKIKEGIPVSSIEYNTIKENVKNDINMLLNEKKTEYIENNNINNVNDDKNKFKLLSLFIFNKLKEEKGKYYNIKIIKNNNNNVYKFKTNLNDCYIFLVFMCHKIILDNYKNLNKFIILMYKKINNNILEIDYELAYNCLLKFASENFKDYKILCNDCNDGYTIYKIIDSLNN